MIKVSPHRARLSALNDAILIKFKAREAFQTSLATITDPVLKDSVENKIRLIRNDIVELVINDVPDFLDAIAYSWNNSFTHAEALSFIHENLLESVERYTSTKKPFCKFTSFFWMYNKNLLRNRLKKTRAAKRDQRKTHSLDNLISANNDDDDNSRYDTFSCDTDIFETYADKAILKALYEGASIKQRQILKRLYLGYSQSDIAKSLKVTGTNINTVIRRLRKDLEKML
jgi:RNA polymerase sigma factor (sigma-70 family)